MKKTFLYAFRRSLPVMVGYFPLGVAWGLLMQRQGYNALWCLLCSVSIFGGSVQYLMLEFFAAGTALTTVAVMILLLGSRHLFYDLTFLDKFRSFGPLQWALSFLLVDEVYSLYCATDDLPGMDEKLAYLFMGLLCWSYWIGFTCLGALAGQLIRFNTEGMDFVMTALFVVIVIERLKHDPSPLPALIAGFSCVGCLLFFGPDGFLLPSLVITAAGLILARPVLEPALPEEEARP